MSATWLDLLQQIFQICIIPLLSVLTAFAIKFVNAKSDELKTKTDNDTLNKYIDMVRETIIQCVVTTNQTYVDALKDKNAFDAEAQKTAFQLTYNAVLAILSEDAKEYLTNAFGDLQTYLTTMIEKEVNYNKQPVQSSE